ncbi:uncharacterized protein BP5553_03052 [Venustampulla echinocandica]|uniref:Cytochrome P450 n=1 Tax=Venustampulla echinocandica TaxID=2656787 RepID=A0A370TT57_9HELO|nr:uncharacterized protein BP5553_03052 [Venustampulla echinocandica]RDL38712.1 hypothetical protein BP5553_03052 [Venustampulla echinocandica]
MSADAQIHKPLAKIDWGGYAPCEIGTMNIQSVFLMDFHGMFTQWVIKWSLISLLLVAFVAYIIYFVTNVYLEHRADAALGLRHRCQPPPELPWPLGLDRIKELWDSNSEGHLLAFLCSIAKNYEPRNNLSQFLLVGPRAFHILHPRTVRPFYLQTLRTTTSEFDAISSHPYWAMVSSPKRDWPGSTQENLCENRRPVYSLRADIDQDNENKLFAESFTIAQEERYIREQDLQKDKAAVVEASCGFIDQVRKESVSNTDLRDQILNVLLAGRGEIRQRVVYPGRSAFLFAILA